MIKSLLYTPQIVDYYELGISFHPYLMFYNRPNFISPSVNTDKHGFRFSYAGDKKLENPLENENEGVTLILGGSAALGVGASNDKYTIASYLNGYESNPSIKCYNFGGHAFTSSQELLLFQFFASRISNIKRIILFSGVNDLVIFLSSNHWDKTFGTHFFLQHYIRTENPKSVTSKLKKFYREMTNPLSNRVLRKKGSFYIMNKEIPHKDRAYNIEEKLTQKEMLIERLSSNFFIWGCIAKALGSEIHYVLQPMPNWTQKKLSIEEQELFSELDSIKRNRWCGLSDQVTPLYEWYSNSLKRISSQNGLFFTDMNIELSASSLDEKWIFVDRAHLNDYGYERIARIISSKFKKR